jgi:hypothetical protein
LVPDNLTSRFIELCTAVGIKGVTLSPTEPHRLQVKRELGLVPATPSH